MLYEGCPPFFRRRYSFSLLLLRPNAHFGSYLVGKKKPEEEEVGWPEVKKI